MKNLARSLGINPRQCVTQDDDAIDGVFATPGPRAQGDEASEPSGEWSAHLHDLSAPATGSDAFDPDAADDPIDGKTLS